MYIKKTKQQIINNAKNIVQIFQMKNKTSDDGLEAISGFPENSVNSVKTK